MTNLVPIPHLFTQKMGCAPEKCAGLDQKHKTSQASMGVIGIMLKFLMEQQLTYTKLHLNICYYNQQGCLHWKYMMQHSTQQLQLN